MQPWKETMEESIHCAPPPVSGVLAALFSKVQETKLTSQWTSVIPPPINASFDKPLAKAMPWKVTGRAVEKFVGANRRMSVDPFPVSVTAAPAAARTVKAFGDGRS